MNCRDVLEKDLLERYVVGTLSEEERAELEIHFLGCERCTADLETTIAIRDALRGLRVRAGARRRRVFPWLAAAAGIVLVAGLSLWWVLRSPSSPGTELAQAPAPSAEPRPAPVPSPSLEPEIPEAKLLELARIEPPPYEEPVLRGPGGKSIALFRQAMQPYRRGEYEQAIPGLERAMADDGSADHTGFFLGISYLLAGRVDRAIETLRASASLAGSPFADEARFYLAKALIRAGRLDEARVELRNLVSSQGGLAADAKELLERMDEILPPG